MHKMCSIFLAVT